MQLVDSRGPRVTNWPPEPGQSTSFSGLPFSLNMRDVLLPQTLFPSFLSLEKMKD